MTKEVAARVQAFVKDERTARIASVPNVSLVFRSFDDSPPPPRHSLPRPIFLGIIDLVAPRCYTQAAHLFAMPETRGRPMWGWL